MNSNKFALRNYIVVLCLLLVLVSVLAYALYQELKSPTKETVVPEVITSVLSEYLDSEYMTTYNNSVFRKYFLTLTDEELEDNEGMSETELAFYEVFKMYSPGVTSFKAEAISSNFVKVTLFDESNVAINPPVGFWFELDTTEEHITDWRLGRLQPFSRYDEEYSEKWDELFGE